MFVYAMICFLFLAPATIQIARQLNGLHLPPHQI